MAKTRSFCVAAAFLLLAGPAPAAKPTPLRPAGNPGDWIRSDDYPPDAMRAGAQGVTGFTLDIDMAGHVTACDVTASSGNAALDAVSCILLSTRASFLPARDRRGVAIASRYSGRIRWALPHGAGDIGPATIRFASCMANDLNEIQVETANGCAH